jgi:hypothetical protein
MNDTCGGSYKNKFQSADIARIYDEVLYGAGTYASVIGEIEKCLLLDIVGKLRSTHPRIEYLDFATGTGRILSFMEDRVDKATGIEISGQMAQRARAKLRAAAIDQYNLTNSDPKPESKYDLITAFRFVGNAETELRYSAMRAITGKLRDHTSILIFNNHRNPLSYKGLLWPASRMRAPAHAYCSSGNFLSSGEVERMVRSVGLVVREVHGYGFLSSKLTSLMPLARQVKWERWLAGSRLAKFGVCQLYVCTRR